MNTKLYQNELNNTFTKISKMGLSDKNLYDKLWIDINNFLLLAFTSRTSHKKNGEITCGNEGKIEALINNEITTLEDLRQDLTIKIVSEIDNILKVDEIGRIPYTFQIVNNYINTECKKISKMCISFQEPLQYSEGTNQLTLEDTLTDKKNIDDELKAKDLLLSFISKIEKSAELFSFLTLTLSLKNDEVYEMLTKRGLELTKYQIVSDVETMYHLNENEIDEILSLLNTLKEEDLKLDTNDKEKIKDQISKLRDRAKNKIKSI